MLLRMPEQNTEKNTHNTVPKFVIPIIVIILIILSVLITIFVLKQKPEILGGSKTGNQTTNDTKSLIAAVGKLMVLPSGEEPTVATVTDVTKLEAQPFFKNAKNNDKVLIYSNAKKAILYRQSENKIIEVGDVNIDNNNDGTASSSPAPSASPKTLTPKPSPTLTPTLAPATPSATPNFW